MTQRGTLGYYPKRGLDSRPTSENDKKEKEMTQRSTGYPKSEILSMTKKRRVLCNNKKQDRYF